MYKQIGMSVLDVIITLALIGILTSLATPALTAALAKSESLSVQFTIRRALAAAREFAINSESPVRICGINEEYECVKENFKTLAIFHDPNNDKVVDITEELIVVRDLNYDAFLKLGASLGRKYIQFNQDGSSSQAGSFIYCNKNFLNYSARVTVSMPGRAYIATDKDGDGYVELTNGDRISC